MDFINPITFANSMLTSISVPEHNAYLPYNPATAYTVDQYCYLASTHKVYQCLIANTGASPDVNVSGLTPKWLEVGATNSFAAFDDKWGTQTTSTTSLTVTLTPGIAIDSLALLNLIGKSVSIVCTVGGVTKYSKTIPLQTDVGVFDWKTYFIAPIVAQDDVVVTDLLPYSLQVITITVTGVGTVAIGNIAMGSVYNLGVLEWGAKPGITDYSLKTKDGYGHFKVTPRAYSKRFSGRFSIENKYVDQVAAVLASIRSTPVVWIGVGSIYSSLIVWGFYKDFEIDIAYYNQSYCSITIEGIS